MDSITSVSQSSLTCTVQPGVHRLALNESLSKEGLFFPVDPGADATIGGMCSTNCSGTSAVRYGVMRTNVLALTVVNPDGELVKCGTDAFKNSAGYSLKDLYVGSEVR
jgi:D-lactate dehydrogenase (cytochrome)